MRLLRPDKSGLAKAKGYVIARILQMKTGFGRCLRTTQRGAAG